MTAPTTPPMLGTMARMAAEQPSTVALHLPRGWRHRAGTRGFSSLTFGALHRRSEATAAALASVGIGPGVRAALLVPPSTDFFSLAVALVNAGAVPVLVDPGLGLRHVRQCLAEADVTAFIGVARAHLARRALRWCSEARTVVTVGAAVPGGGPTLRSLLRAAGQATAAPAGAPHAPVGGAPVGPDPLAAIAFTSGSTGPPKGVAYRHRHFAAQLELVRELCAVEPGEVALATFPPFALLSLLLGLTTVVPRMDPTRPASVDPRRVVDAASTFAATTMFGSPALVDTVGRFGARTGTRMPSLRRVVSAGAPVGADVQRRILRMLAQGADIVTPYGATEALPVTWVSSTELQTLTEPGVCVGRPVPGVDVAIIEIRDEPVPVLREEMRVPAGDVGEVVVRGANVTDAYVGRPLDTAQAKTDWGGLTAHRMGDLGRFDADGRLWFCGRKAHRVTTATGTLTTSPLEERVNAHPGVRRSALVGVGPAGSQRAVICVQLEHGRRGSPALTASLLARLSADPDTAAVETLLYVTDLPVDIRHNAKIDRTAVAAWATRKLT